MVQQVPAARRHGVRPCRGRVHLQLLPQHVVLHLAALKKVNGDISDGGKKLQAVLAKTVVPGAYGTVRLDKNRQAIQPQYSYRMNVKAGALSIQTVQYIPPVDQWFGGSIKAPPSRTYPKCVNKKLPWTGKARPVVNGVVK